jgi:hypothetical protein
MAFVYQEEEWLYNNKINVLTGGDGLALLRGFFFQKFFERFCENTFRISGPAVFFPTMTGLLFFFQYDLMKLARETGSN